MMTPQQEDRMEEVEAVRDAAHAAEEVWIEAGAEANGLVADLLPYLETFGESMHALTQANHALIRLIRDLPQEAAHHRLVEADVQAVIERTLPYRIAHTTLVMAINGYLTAMEKV